MALQSERPLELLMPPVSLSPKEHGAYGQLAFPLVTSLAIADVTAPAVLIATTAIAGFLAHEPLMVSLGQRGPRAKRDAGRRAAVWLAVTAVIVVAAGATAVSLVPPDVRWSFLLPLVPLIFLVVAVARRREKSAGGEIAVALTFSLVAIPLCLAGGADSSSALAVGIAFASTFVTSTLSVRLIVIKMRSGGNPRAARTIRLLIFVLSALLAAALVAAALQAALPWATVLAIAPGVLAAIALSVWTPSATRLRTVGWTLASVSAVTTIILIAGL